MANDHTIWIKQGAVNNAVESNKNPSVAQSTQQAQGQSAIGTAINAGVFIQSAKQISSSLIGNIGYATGNYELQETAEGLMKIGGVVIGLMASPAAAVATVAAVAISTGFELYTINTNQTRNQFKQQQAQILTGKIAVNQSRW